MKGVCKLLSTSHVNSSITRHDISHTFVDHMAKQNIDHTKDNNKAHLTSLAACGFSITIYSSW